MKTNFIRLIIVFSALALVGLIVTQSFWVDQAIEITQKHFEHRAQTVLHITVEEIRANTDSSACVGKYKTNAQIILCIIKPHILDSLLKKYATDFRLDKNYEFAIVKNYNDSIIYSTKGFNNNYSSEKIFRHCLSSIYNREHYSVELIFPNLHKSLLLKVWGWLLLSVIFIIVIVLCFGFIVFTIFRQKKLSDMKTDFINNMTHEFKTPISTISLASEVLLNANKNTNIEKIHQYSKIIFDENLRMRSQVEQVLRMAQLDKGEYEINKEETDIHELITNSVNSLYLEHCSKPVDFVFSFNAENHVLNIDIMHIGNVIKNLVENAYKYSCNNPKIEIYTFNKDSGIIISIKDNGIGIDSVYQQYIFDKFYRVPTGDIHNVKGFGIGLYYVKVIVNAHGGHITVKSEIEKGSKFDIFLPIINL